MPHLERSKVVLVHYNTVSNDYQQNLRVWNRFAPSKFFGQSLDILPKNVVLLKTFNQEFPFIELLFTDQNSKPLEIEDKINITLLID